MYNIETSDQIYVEPDTIWADDDVYKNKHITVEDLPPYTRGPHYPIEGRRYPPMRTKRIDERENRFLLPFGYRPAPPPPNREMTIGPTVPYEHVLIIIILFFMILVLLSTMTFKVMVDVMTMIKKNR